MWGAALVGKPWIASHSPQRPNPPLNKMPHAPINLTPRGFFMSSKIFEIDSTQWTKVTDGESSGSYLAIGSETAYIYQGDTAPTDTAGVAPIMDTISSAYPHPYSSLGAQHLYARTVSGTTSIHITAGG